MKKPRAGGTGAGQQRARAGGQISAPSQRNTLGAALFPSSDFFFKNFSRLENPLKALPNFGSIALAVVGRRASATFRFFVMACLTRPSTRTLNHAIKPMIILLKLETAHKWRCRSWKARIMPGHDARVRAFLITRIGWGPTANAIRAPIFICKVETPPELAEWFSECVRHRALLSRPKETTPYIRSDRCGQGFNYVSS
jgi:hypothetical protein